MRRHSAPTLQDVAEQAGVSAMMASVVLNGARSSTRVSEATRARITEAAARLGYRRNAAALGLSRRQMDTIGVAAVVDGREINLYFLEVINGILEGATEHAQNTTVFSIPSWTDHDRLLNCCDGRIDGLILIAPEFTPAFAQELARHTAYVTLHSNVQPPALNNLEVDNAGGAYAIVQHLIAMGHRRILHLSGGYVNVDSLQRLAGYRRALEDAGIPIDESLIIDCGFSVSLGRHHMGALLEKSYAQPLPTAVFCASDAIAFGCIEALNSRNIRVPEDISVAGFDDSLLARMTRPPLTTVRQPLRKMGRCAVERLLQLTRSKQALAESEEVPGSDVGSEVFAVEIVIRESVSPPPSSPVIVPS